MNVQRGDTTIIQGANYTLIHDAADPHYVRLCFDSGIGARLLLPSGCDRDERIDEFVRQKSLSVRETGSAVELTAEYETTLWSRAVYTFRCEEERVLYGYTVYGDGKIDSIRFFEGFLQNDPDRDRYFYPYFCGPNRQLSYHRSYKEFAHSSTPEFTDVFTFAINSSDRRWFKYYQEAKIRINSDRHYDGGDWLATPPPYLYLLSDAAHSACVTMGLVVRPGENSFLEYTYLGGEGFGLSLDYDGYTRCEGAWSSPRILFGQYAADEYAALDGYCEYLRAVGVCPDVDRSNTPDWWRRPIFGGWGEQVYHSNRWPEFFGQKAQNWDNDNVHLFCTQSAYETMLATLERNGVDPTILIVDNRWFQADYQFDVDETLWPDMKGFIQRQHAKGRKVILWASPWHYCHSGTGLDVPVTAQMIYDERNAYTLRLDTDVFYKACKLDMVKKREPVVIPPSTLTEPTFHFFADPQNPAYEALLRSKIEYLLSPDGLDADGFEFDYTHFLPMHRGLMPTVERDRQLYGAELLHALMEIYYSAAKQAKPDALIIAHTFNPYFNDVVDMLRLQDIYTDRASVVPQMNHRAQIAKRVMPGCAIHTDQHPMPSRAAWREYARFQPSIGNPCLYYVTGIETTRELLEESDFAMLRETWSEYNKSLDEGGNRT